jgi:hypothetical protein
MPNADSPALPRTVWAAAAALSGYGVALLLVAVLQQNALGWEDVDAQQFQGPLSRFVVMNVIAWGLSQRARWAWWAGLVVPGFFLLATVAAFLVYLTGPPDAVRASPPSFILSAFFLTLLILPVVLLLSRASREAFRRRAA